MKEKKEKIPIIKTGNFLLVDTLEEPLLTEIKQVLTYERTTYDRTKKGTGMSPMIVDQVPVWEVDRDGKVATMFGYYNLIRKKIMELGREVKPIDHSHEPSDRYTPDWENLESYGFEFRPSQKELLQKIATSRCGRVDCATGYGKSFVIGAICALFPKATIDIVCKSVSVVRERIHPELVQLFGAVGLVGGGVNKRANRINCYTADSMKKSPGTSDFLIGDEIHMLATDRLVGEMIKWNNSRNFGFTASMNARFDGCDFMLHGIFGPLIFKYGYQQSVDAGVVVPIQVRWTKVNMSYNPVENVSDDTRKIRLGIWRNSERNRLIAQDARRYNDDKQVLITCATFEHALALKQELPEFTVVYRAPANMNRLRVLASQGLWDLKQPLMTLDQRSELAKKFESGELKKVICTTVWNVGVSFDMLSVLIRADGTASTINDIQIPGRVSRLDEGKKVAIVHDYDDVFDRGFRNKSARRRSNYIAQGWEQIDQ